MGDKIKDYRAVKRAFGEHVHKLAISSTKSMTGHLLGGAGGLEAGIAVLALRDQIAPPTINLETPGEGCDLDYVPNHARPMEMWNTCSPIPSGSAAPTGVLYLRRSDKHCWTAIVHENNRRDQTGPHP